MPVARDAASDTSAWFDAVYAAPDDDGARQVLADVLLEHQDPRGELIALQMLPRRTRKADLKLERLMERHRAEFLGPLKARVLSNGQVWEKGFLVECRATLDGTLVDEPSWATVRALEIGNRADEVPLELLSPQLRSLREISGLPRPGVALVFAAKQSLPFWSISVDGPGNAEAWSLDELDALRRASALPALRHLGLKIWRFGLEELTWLWTAPVFGRLRSLELGTHRVAVHLGHLQEQLRQLDDVPDALILKGRQLELKLKPEDAFRVMQLTVRVPLVDAVLADAEVMLQSLAPDALTRLDVLCATPVTRDQLARLKGLVRRFPRLAPVSWPKTSR